LTTRDNGTPVGQFDFDNMKVTVEDTGKAFEVTSQQNPETFHTDESKTITWEVAATNLDPINTNFVNILLSTDGGNTFPITLASNIPNNGSYPVTIPSTATNQARIKVAAVGNIFYSINTANLIIEDSKFVMSLEENPLRTCVPDDAIYQFEYNTYLGFNETTTFSVANSPEGTTAVFSPTTATADGTMVTLTISNSTEELIGDHELILTGAAPSEENSVNLILSIGENITTLPYLSFPENNQMNLPTSFKFSWETESESNDFIIDIASDLEFSNIIQSHLSLYKTQTINNLEENTTYYWRVRETNNCETGGSSLIYKFTTAALTEFNFSNNSIIHIPDNDPEGITSKITITDAIEIFEV
jgi:hypothetical protein